MSMKTVNIPFNKDLCTLAQLKEAAETLDTIFGIIEARQLNSDLSKEDFQRTVGRSVMQFYEHWQQKYPVKEGNS